VCALQSVPRVRIPPSPYFSQNAGISSLFQREAGGSISIREFGSDLGPADLMIMRKNKIETIDDYIASCPEAVRPKLEKLRRAIRSAAPRAEEAISYRMPAFKWNGPLVYFAAFKTHIGFFPTSSPIPVFKKELSAFKTSKGTIRFPLDRPIPFDLVKKIVRFKLKENSARGIKAAP
jgi:uncharacterized protein YdhG (YjbR/CyaY superfamily)